VPRELPGGLHHDAAAPAPAVNRARYERHIARSQRNAQQHSALLAERKRGAQPAAAPRSK
jgi:hypothetical protein